MEQPRDAARVRDAALGLLAVLRLGHRVPAAHAGRRPRQRVDRQRAAGRGRGRPGRHRPRDRACSAHARRRRRSRRAALPRWCSPPGPPTPRTTRCAPGLPGRPDAVRHLPLAGARAGRRRLAPPSPGASVSLLEPVQHALAAVVAGVHSGLDRPRRRRLLGPDLVPVDRRRRGRRPHRPAADRRARRADGARLVPRPSRPQGDRRALQGPHRRRQRPGHDGGAPRGLGRARRLPPRLPAACCCRSRSGSRSTTCCATSPTAGRSALSTPSRSPRWRARPSAASHLTVPRLRRPRRRSPARSSSASPARRRCCRFATQRYLVQPNSSATDLPEAMASAQRVVPFVSAAGMLLAGHRRAGGPALLLGLRRGLDLHPVGGRLALLPHARLPRRAAVGARRPGRAECPRRERPLSQA